MMLSRIGRMSDTSNPRHMSTSPSTQEIHGSSCSTGMEAMAAWPAPSPACPSERHAPHRQAQEPISILVIDNEDFSEIIVAIFVSTVFIYFIQNTQFLLLLATTILVFKNICNSRNPIYQKS